MRVEVELDALLKMLGIMASDAKDQARIDFPGTEGDAVTMGIAFLHEHQRITLEDASEFDLSPETETQALQKAIGKFCRRSCYFSREDEPGVSEACAVCPLMPFTVGVIEKVVDKAMGTKPAGQEGAFDPDVVAKARAKMDEDIKAGKE